MKRAILLLVTALLLLSAASVLAAESPQPVRVAIAPHQPCVAFNKAGTPHGFDIDIWEAIADENGAIGPYEFVRVDHFTHLFDLLNSGQADVAMAGITINAQREAQFDFSQPYLDTGLRIMVRSESEFSLRHSFNQFSSVLLVILVAPELWMFILFVIVGAHLIWYGEIGHDASIPDKYIPGIFVAIYFTITTASTVGYGDIAPKKGRSKVIAVVLMFAGILLFGALIGRMSSMDFGNGHEITGPQDLVGKSVATKAGTTSVEAIASYRGNGVTYPTITAAIAALTNKEVDAVVFDEPTLLDHALRHSEVTLTGPVFDRQAYGVMVAQGNYALREQINQGLLEIQEDGQYGHLYAKYFE